MAEVLFFNRDTVQTDPENNRRCYKRGYPVVGKPTGFQWGNLETLPDFVKVIISDATDQEIASYFEEWERKIDYQVVANNVALDGYRLRVFATETSILDYGVNAGKITKDMVETFLNKWNASVVTFGDNSVTFDIGIYNATTSEKFWEGRNIQNIVFSEVSYDQGTGVHVIAADYRNTNHYVPKSVVTGTDGQFYKCKQTHTADVENQPITGANWADFWELDTEAMVSTQWQVLTDYTFGVDNADAIIKAIKREECTYISHADGVVNFSVTRGVIREKFKEDVKMSVEKPLYRRKFYLPTSVVDAIVTAGGVITRTKAQVASYIKNKLTDT